MSDIDFKFESFEEYFGDANQVKKTMDECKVCGSKLLLSHMPDYKNLLVQETARCMDCGCGNRRVIHIRNSSLISSFLSSCKCVHSAFA